MRGATISQLFYMQAIKLNDKRIYSNDRGKPFGGGKCSCVKPNGGRIIGVEGLELSKDHIIETAQLQDPRNAATSKKNNLLSSTHSMPYCWSDIQLVL